MWTSWSWTPRTTLRRTTTSGTVACFDPRFEEPGGDKIQTFPREIPDSMRRKEESKRAKKNKNAAERKKEQKRKLKEEMKRLRHLEKEKLEKQLEAFLKVSGASKKKVEEIRQSLEEGEFDPKKYEVAMQTVFDEKYDGRVDRHRPAWSEDEQEEEDLGIERGKMKLDDDAVLEVEEAAEAAEAEEAEEEYEAEMPKFDLQKYLDEHFPGTET